jgi:hypothetical protein
MVLISENDVIDSILNSHKTELGNDFNQIQESCVSGV